MLLINPALGLCKSRLQQLNALGYDLQMLLANTAKNFLIYVRLCKYFRSLVANTMFEPFYIAVTRLYSEYLIFAINSVNMPMSDHKTAATDKYSSSFVANRVTLRSKLFEFV